MAPLVDNTCERMPKSVCVSKANVPQRQAFCEIPSLPVVAPPPTRPTLCHSAWCSPRGLSFNSSFCQLAPSMNFEWKPGIQPTMLCLPIGWPVWTRASEGSSAMTFTSGFFCFR